MLTSYTSPDLPAELTSFLTFLWTQPYLASRTGHQIPHLSCPIPSVLPLLPLFPNIHGDFSQVSWMACGKQSTGGLFSLYCLRWCGFSQGRMSCSVTEFLHFHRSHLPSSLKPLQARMWVKTPYLMFFPVQAFQRQIASWLSQSSVQSRY